MTIPDEALRVQLIERAHALADEREWVWLEPVEITAEADRGEPVWVVRTNALSRGMNIQVVFRRIDNTVVRAGYLPR